MGRPILKTCQGCKINTKRIRTYKTFFYCYKCYIKKVKLIISTTRYHSIEEAQEKIRNVINIYLEGNIKGGYVFVPCCYIGKKVRVIVVDDG